MKHEVLCGYHRAAEKPEAVQPSYELVATCHLWFMAWSTYERSELRVFLVPYRTGTQVTELKLFDLVHFHILKGL